MRTRLMRDSSLGGSPIRPRRVAIAASVVVATLVVGCNGPSAVVAPGANPGAVTGMHGTYICTAIVPSLGALGAPSVTCVPATGSSRRVSGTAGRPVAEDVVLETQNVNVKLALSNFSYNTSTHVFGLNCTVKNLLTQPIGTLNGTTTTAGGVRVYFVSGPVPNNGIGTVSVSNADGDTLFQGQMDPYFKYTPLIKANATSAPKTWTFQLSADATGFNFAVGVDAAVPAQNSVLRWVMLRQGVTPNQLNAAWRNTATNVWAVGLSGTVLRYTGAQWGTVATGLSSHGYTGVWGTSASDVWAVGNAGAAVHYDGTTWTLATTGSSANWSGIWGSGANDYYATATGGQAFHYDGSSWSAISFPFSVTKNLHAVWGVDASHVYIAGDAGTILFFNGTSWSQIASPSNEPLFAIWGSSVTDIYMAGGLGTIVHYNGTSWGTEASGTTHQISGLGGTGSADIWAVGSPGVTQHFDGTTWSTVSPVVGLLISAVASGSPGPLWAVGGSGALLTLSGTQATLSNQSGLQLLGVWASSATDVWAAAPGTVLHYDGTNWTSAYVSANDPMESVWGTGPNSVYMVGARGTIAAYNGSAWTSAVVNPPSPPDGYNAVFGTTASDVYAVGNAGLVEHFDGTAWSFVTRTGSGDLNGVWGGGSPATYFAVAADGTAYTSANGGPWGAVSFSPANGVALNGVFGTSPTNVWATGNTGAAYIDTASGLQLRLRRIRSRQVSEECGTRRPAMSTSWASAALCSISTDQCG